MALPIAWVPVQEVCDVLKLSRHQIRHAINRGTLLPGEHWLPGPTPSSPRRYNIAAIHQCLIEVAQNRLSQNKSTTATKHESIDAKIRKCEAELNLKKLELERLLAEREARSQGKDSPPA